MNRGRSLGRIWGPINAEDLVVVPGADWVVTSGKTGVSAPMGRLYAVHIQDHRCVELFPYLAESRLDSSRFGDERELDPSSLAPHGLDITMRGDGSLELYVVNHGGQESVEVFEVALRGQRPTLTWIGRVKMPGEAIGNDVAILPGGGFVVSSTGKHSAGGSILTGANLDDEKGCALEWSLAGGWKVVPGSNVGGANGVAVSQDGREVFLGGFSSRCVKKVSRSGAVKTSVRESDLLVDNLTWTPGGYLLAAGSYRATFEEFLAGHFSPNPRWAAPSRVVLVDPNTLEQEVIVEYGPEIFGVATTGLQVGTEVWVGASRDEGLARFSGFEGE